MTGILMIIFGYLIVSQDSEEDFYIRQKTDHFYLVVTGIKQYRDYTITGIDSSGKKREQFIAVTYDLRALSIGDTIYKRSGTYTIFIQKRDTLLRIPLTINAKDGIVRY